LISGSTIIQTSFLNIYTTVRFIQKTHTKRCFWPLRMARFYVLRLCVQFLSGAIFGQTTIEPRQRRRSQVEIAPSADTCVVWLAISGAPLMEVVTPVGTIWDTSPQRCHTGHQPAEAIATGIKLFHARTAQAVTPATNRQRPLQPRNPWLTDAFYASHIRHISLNSCSAHFCPGVEKIRVTQPHRQRARRAPA
jgi:hypothetical protein